MTKQQRKTTRVRKKARTINIAILAHPERYHLSPSDRTDGLHFLENRMFAEARKTSGFGLDWQDEDWQLTENIRQRYVYDRSIELFSVLYSSEWNSFISLLSKGCRNLIIGIERDDLVARGVWKYLDDNGILRTESLRDTIRTLTDHAGKTSDVSILEGDAWSKFVVCLAEQWRAKGLRPTAPKSSDLKRSDFVGWVAFLMLNLPEPLWQYAGGAVKPESANWGALNHAVWRALRERKRILGLIEQV
jgi:hypothetical protein